MEYEWIRRKLLIRDLTQALEAHPNVLRVQNKYHYLKITFDTGISEHWVLTEGNVNKKRIHKLPFDKEYFNDFEIKTHKQFETNKSLYPEDYEILKNHFIIKNKDLKKAGWCDIRFKVHDLAVSLVEEGYLPVKYTDDILKQDLESLKNENVKRYQYGPTKFSSFSNFPPSGKRLIMHFMPCYAEKYWDFYSLYKSINKLLHNDITRENVVYHLSKKHHIVRRSAFYRAIFQQWFDISGKTVYDLHPDWGFKALAIMVEGGHYYCNSPHINNLKMMGEFMEGKVDAPNLKKYDLIILSDLSPMNINEVHSLISNFRGLAEYLMITIKNEDCQNLIKQYKPKCTLRFSDRVTNNTDADNYIMIIKPC